MTERPILFSGPMVRAILDGRKTQTRRVITDRLWHVDRETDDDGWPIVEGDDPPSVWVRVRCPYGVVGDRLWVRETWAEADVPCGVEYKADQPCDATGWGWRPSIHMPRWASRITLEITDIRVQRVQDISEDDRIAEGCPAPDADWYPDDDEGRQGRSLSSRCAFEWTWDSINAKRGHGWDANPWVWAITFRRVEA